MLQWESNLESYCIHNQESYCSHTLVWESKLVPRYIYSNILQTIVTRNHKEYHNLYFPFLFLVFVWNLRLLTTLQYFYFIMFSSAPLPVGCFVFGNYYQVGETWRTPGVCDKYYCVANGKYVRNTWVTQRARAHVCVCQQLHFQIFKN